MRPGRRCMLPRQSWRVAEGFANEKRETVGEVLIAKSTPFVPRKA